MQQILILGTEAALNNRAGMNLAREGYAVHIANNTTEGLRAFYRVRPDLVVLDVSADTPEFQGWGTYRRIHELADVPVMILTANQTGSERLEALQAGADDCLSKPFHVQELTSRVSAILRRTETPLANLAQYEHNGIVIDLDKRQVKRHGQLVDITAREFALLAFLAHNAGHTLTPQQLLQEVWGSSVPPRSGLLKLYIWHLRRKLEEDPAKPQIILTDRGAGYLLAKREV